MDKKSCMSKQLKWNKFPFYVDRLFVKIIQRDYHRQTGCLRKSLKKNHSRKNIGENG